MKAITVSEPYASLLASGEKWVENRRQDWRYRGPIVIHAGKGTQYLTRDELKAYPAGCAIALAEIAACFHVETIRERSKLYPDSCPVPDYGMTWRQINEHEHTEGPFCLIVVCVRKLIKPVPMRGALGLWNVDPKTAEALQC